MSQLTKRQLIVEDQLINFYERSSETAGAVTLLFLHGWRSNGLVWKSVIDLLPTELNIYALDLPGFGESELPKRDFSVDDYAKIVRGFVSKIGIQSFILIGHSFGGRVGIKLASAHMPSLQKLVLAAVPAIRSTNPSRTLKQTVATILRPLFRLSALAGLRRQIYKLIGAEDYIATPELKGTFIKVLNEDLSPFLDAIEVPTLLLWGDQDSEVPVETAKQTKDKITKSRLVILSPADHFVFLDKPTEFAEQLTNFIKS